MRGNKGFILLFFVLAIASLLLALAFRPPNDDKWTNKTAQIARMKSEARTRTLPHSTIHGKLTPGNAWQEYNIALQEAAAWKEDDPGFTRYLKEDEQLNRAGVEIFVAERATLLERLQRGARRSDGQYPYAWEQGHRMPQPSPVAARRLANLAATQARILAEKGQTQESANLLIDLTVLGRDLATNSPLRSNVAGLSVT